MVPPMRDLLLVGAGGFLGAVMRYILTAWVAVRAAHWFGWESLPAGTLFVNVTGSFLLAVFSVWITSQGNWSQDLRLLVGTGFFGAYTTFSTFANEGIALWRTENAANGLFYIVLTNVLCLTQILRQLGYKE